MNAANTLLNYVTKKQIAESWSKFVQPHSTIASKMGAIAGQIAEHITAAANWPVSRAEFLGAKLLIDGKPLIQYVQIKALVQWQKNMARSHKRPRMIKDAEGNPTGKLTVVREIGSTRGRQKDSLRSFAMSEYQERSRIEKAFRERGIRWQYVAKKITSEFEGKWNVGLPQLMTRHGVPA